MDFRGYLPVIRLINKKTAHASMKTTAPPRLRAKKEKKAPHNDAINQYSLVSVFLSASSFDRGKTTPTNFMKFYL
jgi:hypothetical protein